MRFEDPDITVTPRDIDRIQQTLGIDLPVELREQYLRHNGGVPDPYVYEDQNLDTVVSEILPIASNRGAKTAVDAYVDLVLTKQIVAAHFFPFAVDGGGDYFFVNCQVGDGRVSFYRHDLLEEGSNLLALGLRVDGFLASLKAE